MIRVTFGNNVDRQTVIVDSTTTPHQILIDAGIDYSRGAWNINGALLRPGDFDRSLADLGVTETCSILNVVKTDNA